MWCLRCFVTPPVRMEKCYLLLMCWCNVHSAVHSQIVCNEFKQRLYTWLLQQVRTQKYWCEQKHGHSNLFELRMSMNSSNILIPCFGIESHAAPRQLGQSFKGGRQVCNVTHLTFIFNFFATSCISAIAYRRNLRMLHVLNTLFAFLYLKHSTAQAPKQLIHWIGTNLDTLSLEVSWDQLLHQPQDGSEISALYSMGMGDIYQLRIDKESCELTL